MLVDLSVSIEEGMNRIPVLPEVRVEPVLSLAKGDPLEIRKLTIATHIGTHVDAPSHAILGGATIDQIPLDRLAGPGVIIAVEGKPGEPIGLEQVLQAGPAIEPGDIVLLSTGFARLMADPVYHRNPYPSQELADYLVARGVKMLGVDCITVDMPTMLRPPGFTFPIHKTLLGNGILIIENLGDMSAVAGRRAQIWAFPLKIRGADAGHARVVAEIS